MTALNGWSFLYDAEGRMTSACQAASCTGSGFNRLDATYDGQGHRTQLRETTAAGAVTTTGFRYAGDAITAETVNGVLARTYVTDDTGRITKLCLPDCSGSNPVYLPTWNGHGDALGLWRVNADGTLTLANSYQYSTWGTPSTAVAAGFTDLGFRFLYVGASDVQWDNAFGLGLLYMHARHHSPVLGRFLQPDPIAAESNPYGYAQNSPVTKTDCTGLMTGECVRIAVKMFIAQINLLERWIDIKKNRGVGDGPLPWAGPPGTTTVATHQEKFREYQRNAEKWRNQWNSKCTNGDGPNLPPGFMRSLGRWIAEPTPNPIKTPPYYRPRFRIRTPAPAWMYLLWPWEHIPCLAPWVPRLAWGGMIESPQPIADEPQARGGSAMTGPYAELCEAYFRYKESDDESLSWAWDQVDAEGFHDPIEKWRQILALLAAAPDDWQIGLLGAGPLEGLLRYHTAAVVDLVEAEVLTNARLRLAIQHVWTRSSVSHRTNEALARIDRLIARAAEGPP